MSETKHPKPMILTITLSVIALVIVNLLLLKFSCNKIEKTRKKDRKPVIFRPLTSSQTVVLAPTGS
ncbi:hypothetical protein GCM10023311_24140 [Flaviramulus aquimarinus]|uniref:Uncharacterized protein n=1 Tax=Flaviramulus aquimarinus TaxID=1170456 RepID=A0ABP9FKT5_9FLAO